MASFCASPETSQAVLDVPYHFTSTRQPQFHRCASCVGMRLKPGTLASSQVSHLGDPTSDFFSLSEPAKSHNKILAELKSTGISHIFQSSVGETVSFNDFNSNDDDLESHRSIWKQLLSFLIHLDWHFPWCPITSSNLPGVLAAQLLLCLFVNTHHTNDQNEMWSWTSESAESTDCLTSITTNISFFAQIFTQNFYLSGLKQKCPLQLNTENIPFPK